MPQHGNCLRSNAYIGYTTQVRKKCWKTVLSSLFTSNGKDSKSVMSNDRFHPISVFIYVPMIKKLIRVKILVSFIL
jgi:hypothetical protein